MKSNQTGKFLLISLALLFILACNIIAPRPIPTPAPPTATPTSIPLSSQVTLVSQSSEETNQTPPFTIKVQTPQLAGSDDTRVTAFNQRLNELVATEVDVWRKSFLENTFPTVINGSFLEVSITTQG